MQDQDPAALAALLQTRLAALDLDAAATLHAWCRELRARLPFADFWIESYGGLRLRVMVGKLTTGKAPTYLILGEGGRGHRVYAELADHTLQTYLADPSDVESLIQKIGEAGFKRWAELSEGGTASSVSGLF